MIISSGIPSPNILSHLFTVCSLRSKNNPCRIYRTHIQDGTSVYHQDVFPVNIQQFVLFILNKINMFAFIHP